MSIILRMNLLYFWPRHAAYRIEPAPVQLGKWRILTTRTARKVPLYRNQNNLRGLAPGHSAHPQGAGGGFKPLPQLTSLPRICENYDIL